MIGRMKKREQEREEAQANTNYTEAFERGSIRGRQSTLLYTTYIQALSMCPGGPARSERDTCVNIEHTRQSG